jgi:hypothetical protein
LKGAGGEESDGGFGVGDEERDEVPGGRGSLNLLQGGLERLLLMVRS